ncbi:hypothetical protein B1729_03515 [Microbacterium sp. B35-04]|uniref:hypothetical protein n=1 Tax=Microbacterium sp. B35-04 TaxID=1961716 RepID=UPI0013D2E923|nr:hypothetical protein [Microbacterium sp. B35-04]KAF2414662.1 hypothetical protein B1729_03515 [Microbacterium sp. B35-04]
MPVVLMLAPAVIGVVVAMLLIRLWPRAVPLLPRRVVALTTIGLGAALTLEVVVLASGSWPFQTIGHLAPLEWLSLIPGGWQFAAPLLAGLVAAGLQCVPAQAGPRRKVAQLAPRTAFSFAPARWVIGAGALTAAAILLALVGGMASSPDERGEYTMWMQDAGVGAVGRLIYGWAFSWPSLVLLLCLTGTTLVGLSLIARPPIGDDPTADMAARRSRSRTILVTVSGAVVLHIGAVLIFFAYTANLNTGVPVGDAIVPIYPPFAIFAPLCLGLGIGAVTVGLVLWFRLLIEQFAAARATAHESASHAH